MLWLSNLRLRLHSIAKWRMAQSRYRLARFAEQMSQYLAEQGILNRDEFNLVAMVAFGYRAEDPKHEQTRQAFDDVVTFVR